MRRSCRVSNPPKYFKDYVDATSRGITSCDDFSSSEEEENSEYEVSNEDPVEDEGSNEPPNEMESSASDPIIHLTGQREYFMSGLKMVTKDY